LKLLELSLHVLDIVENSTRAAAKSVEIVIEENSLADLVTLSISDDGRGMDRQQLDKLTDPFFTTKKVRKVGLGVPLLAQAAHTAGGEFTVDSEPGKGTCVQATFRLSHPDRQPVGDMAGTMVTLIMGNPEVNFIYRHRRDGREYLLDTRELQKELDGLDLANIKVLNFIKEDINRYLRETEVQ
jgi:anti-sigma regulatory factor (Ser/Thr protein kinase)